MKSVNDILRAPIYSDKGNEVGKIDDIIFDEDDGKIKFLSIQPLAEKKHMRVRLTWEEVKARGQALQFQLRLPTGAAKRLLTE